MATGCGALAAALLAGGCESMSSGSREVISPPGGGAGGPFQLGIDVLESSGFRELRGKRVGLITNQTSVNGRGEKTRLVLHRAPEVNLVALYVPEHGLDGTEKAGLKIATRRDPLTGLTAHSLYGSTRKPTPEQLRGIDALVFDLQDIGARSYTYISTMALAMEAAGENGKEFIVLDRPNPIGGLRVQGPPLEERWTSFVGQIPVPYVHGMTAGELALMIHGEGWMDARPQIGVVKMRGWTRNMTWRRTGLRWVPTSPNIPDADSPLYYVATGILGGLTGVDIGIGTSGPFEYAGAKGIDPDEFTAAMQRKVFPGVRFTPYRKASNRDFAGAKLDIDPHAPADLVELDITLLDELNKRTGGRLFRQTSASGMNLFHKVYGSESLARDLQRGVPASAIAASWRDDISRFLRARTRYLLYPAAAGI